MMTYVSIFLTGVFLYLPSALAKPACTATGSRGGPMTVENQADYAAHEIGDFCERNMIVRYLNSIDQAPENCETLPLDQLESYADEKSAQINNKDKSLEVWQNVLISTPKSREMSYRS